MQGIRLDQHTLQIQLAKELPQHHLLVVLTGGVAGLTDRHAQGCRDQRVLGNARGAPPTVGSIDTRKVLPSHTNSSRSVAPPVIWAIVQSQIAAHRHATSTWWKK